jgi:hypothetical protein
MPIPFKAPANSALLNQTFVDKTIDDEKKGKLGLFKNTNADADAIEDIQDFTNEIADTIGQDGEGDANRKTYSSTNFISNGQNRKQAIESLDAQLKTTDDRSLENSTNIANLDNRVTQEVLDLNERIDQEVLDLNDRIDEGAFKIKPYADDAAYEVDFPTPSGGEIYFNTTSGIIRYFDGSVWSDIGIVPIVLQETPSGDIDGVNDEYEIDFNPLTPAHLSLYRNGIFQRQGTEYTISGTTITMTIPPPIASSLFAVYTREF